MSSFCDYCQTPHPNEDPKDQFGCWVTLKSKSLVPIRIRINEVMKMKITSCRPKLRMINPKIR